MYLTIILEVEYFQVGLHNDKNEVVWCAKRGIRPGHNELLFAHIIRLLSNENPPENPAIPGYVWNRQHKINIWYKKVYVYIMSDVKLYPIGPS